MIRSQPTLRCSRSTPPELRKTTTAWVTWACPGWPARSKPCHSRPESLCTRTASATSSLFRRRPARIPSGRIRTSRCTAVACKAGLAGMKGRSRNRGRERGPASTSCPQTACSSPVGLELSVVLCLREGLAGRCQYFCSRRY